jgi:hypothetical protein
LDLQVLLGGILYFAYSPFSSALFHSFRATMKDPGARFFGIEHQTAMLVALIAVHVGHVLSKRKPGPARHRVMRTTLLIFLVVVAVGIPWPWRVFGRPFFRGSW